MDQLNEAINKTREYGRKYGVEYSKRVIKERLISGAVFNEKLINRALEKLRINNYELKIKNKNNKIVKTKEVVKLIEKFFPNILLVGITGSVAAGYPKVDDDIDLMIVTRQNRLWVTRLWLRIFVVLRGIPHRKYGKNEKGDEFCFNLWLEEDVLEIPQKRQNLKNAMDSILMVPVLDRSGIYKKFIRENKWIGRYVATPYSRKSKVKSKKSKQRNETIFLNFINWLVYWPQKLYMKNKIKNGQVDLKRAFFHPDDKIG
ncbi:MAG: nucleotidyltransferase domain-containing protein [Microgenomates group bacterium]